MELSHNLSNKMPKQEMSLPTDVMENILNRLPSTSICRCQTVSKDWCSVIRSFVLNAHSKSSLLSVQLSTTIDHGILTHIIFDDEGKTINIIHKLNLGGTLNYNLSNMVNGLVCAYGNKTTTTFYLANLTTLETSKYTKRKINGTDTFDYDTITLGFDPSMGMYKFIRIYSRRDSCFYHCEILEVGILFKGKWNIIGEIPAGVDVENPVYFNGAVYWIGKYRWSSNEGGPLAVEFLKLDVKKGKFEKVAPIIQNESDSCDYQVCECKFGYSLSEEKGKLYMLHYCCQRKYLYGWRLKESTGDKGVWKVVFHVDLASMAEIEARCLLGRGQFPLAVGIVDGKVLIRSEVYNKGVYIYDILHKKLSKHLDIDRGSFPSDKRKRRMLFYRNEIVFGTSSAKVHAEDDTSSS